MALYQINKTLLQILTTKDKWQKLQSSIHLDRFDKEIRCVLKQINKYWRGHEEDEINMEVFVNKFFIDVSVSESERGYYNKIFELMTDTPDEATAKDLIRNLRLMEFHKEVENAQNDYALGADIDLYETVRSHVGEFEKDIRRDADTGYCTASIKDILDDEENGSQLDWMLDGLRHSMPRLRTGMQIIVAARPGKGKTSFLAHAVTNMLQGEYLKYSNRPIVWFNNEGKKIRIKGSCVRATLRRDFDEIAELGWADASKKYATIIGAEDRLRVYDIHGRDYIYLERIIENDKPAVVVWDMLDNVKGFYGSKGNDRKDQQLEALYQWARECAVKYDFLSLPTSQISVEGADKQWVPDSMLKDSKTGKQGACDAIITIGAVEKQGFEHSRFIYVPKTKFKAAKGFPADCRTEVVFDAARSLFLNPKIGAES